MTALVWFLPSEMTRLPFVVSIEWEISIVSSCEQLSVEYIYQIRVMTDISFVLERVILKRLNKKLSMYCIRSETNETGFAFCEVHNPVSIVVVTIPLTSMIFDGSGQISILKLIE